MYINYILYNTNSCINQTFIRTELDIELNTNFKRTILCCYFTILT